MTGSLLERYADGERKAFQLLVDKYVELVFDIGCRLLKNEADAEDATQETFINIARSAGQFRGRSERAYICAAAVRCSLHMIRSRKRRAERERKFAVEERTDAYVPKPSDAELKDELEKALSQLPLQFRTAVVLHHIEGLSCAEVAQALSIREGTAKSRISRALGRMRKSLSVRGFPAVGAIGKLLNGLPRKHPSPSFIGTCKATAPLASAAVATKVIVGGVVMKKTQLAITALLVLTLASVCGYVVVGVVTPQVEENPTDIALREEAVSRKATREEALGSSLPSERNEHIAKEPEKKHTGHREENNRPGLEETIPKYPYQFPEWYLEVQKALEKHISLDYSDTPLKDVMADMAQQLGVRIEIGPGIDADNLPLTIRISRITGKNALAFEFFLLRVKENLRYEITPAGICIVKSQKGSPLNEVEEIENVLSSIDRSREKLNQEEEKYFKELQSTKAHEFEWCDKTSMEAISEIRTTYNISIVIKRGLDKLELNSKAGLGCFEGNAVDALKHILENHNLTFVIESKAIVVVPRDNRRMEFERQRAEAFESFTSTRLSGKINNEPYHKLIDRLRLDTGVRIYPDRASWEAGIRITLPNSNPTVVEVLDYLEKEHGVKHLFELDTKTHRESLFLLKSR